MVILVREILRINQLHHHIKGSCLDHELEVVVVDEQRLENGEQDR